MKPNTKSKRWHIISMTAKEYNCISPSQLEAKLLDDGILKCRIRSFGGGKVEGQLSGFSIAEKREKGLRTEVGWSLQIKDQAGQILLDEKYDLINTPEVSRDEEPFGFHVEVLV